MKKTLATLVLTAALFVPSFSYAQTPSQDEIRDQYQATLVQLIGLLQQQVQILLGQISALNDKQDSLAQDVKTVKENTTKAPTGSAGDNTVKSNPAHSTDKWDAYYSNGFLYIYTDKDIDFTNSVLTKEHGGGELQMSMEGMSDPDSSDFRTYKISTNPSIDEHSDYDVGLLVSGHSYYHSEDDSSFDLDIRVKMR